MRIDTSVLSRAGGRKTNQDSYAFESNSACGCWVIADGLGGHAGGETASRMAVDIVMSVFHDTPDVSANFILKSFNKAHVAIQEKSAEDFTLAGMRTTLVVLTCNQENAVWGHVGDSRLYWFRKGRIIHQTHDHSIPQMLVDAGEISPEEIRGHEDQNRLIRAMGQEGDVRPTILTKLLPLQAGDAALLCSDGVWTHVLEPEMETDLSDAGSASEWLEKLERRVLERAQGPYDNYTAIAVLFQGPCYPRSPIPIQDIF